MKAFTLLGSLIAMAAGTVYFWGGGGPVGSEPGGPSAQAMAELPATAANVSDLANVRVAEMEKAVKEDEERRAAQDR